MIIVGAITRLTESGLSMVEWRPLIGFIPPLSDAEWQRVFDLYRETPEYQKKNFWMGIDDFKTIFFWEWFHRVLGRLIGIAYAIPLLVFWLRGMIPPQYKLTFIFLLCLGGAQGLMGWYMVQSGLIDQPAVSHYRLAAHLGLAFIILSSLVWLMLNIIKTSLTPTTINHPPTTINHPPTTINHPPSTINQNTERLVLLHALITCIVLAITIIWGAFTAGLDAGLVYNDEFPKMGGQWIPETLTQISPFWLNLFENPVGVQFTHRWLGIVTVIVIASYYIHALRKHHNHWSIHVVTAMAFIQMSLGITTLLSQVHIAPATLHQGGAAILLCLMVINCHHLLSSREQTPSADHPSEP